MGIENIINKSHKGMRNTALAGMLVAGAAGCTSMDNKRYETSHGVQGIPTQDIGNYESGDSFVLPRFNIDGRDNKYFAPNNTSEHLNWMEDSRLKIRSAAECPQHYSLLKDSVVLFPDESYCIVDLCKESAYKSNQSPHRGGDGGGGTSAGGSGPGPGPGPGNDSGGGPGTGGGSNGGDGVR